MGELSLGKKNAPVSDGIMNKDEILSAKAAWSILIESLAGVIPRVRHYGRVPFFIRIEYPNSGSVMGDYAEGWTGWRVVDAEVMASVCRNSFLVRRSVVKSSLRSVPRDSFGLGIWPEVQRTISRGTT